MGTAVLTGPAIRTGHRLIGQLISLRWGRDFPHTSRPALRPTQPPTHDGYRVSFLRVKLSGRGFENLLPLSVEDKERIDLYLYSPSGISWLVLACILRLPLPLTHLSSSLGNFFIPCAYALCGSDACVSSRNPGLLLTPVHVECTMHKVPLVHSVFLLLCVSPVNIITSVFA